MYAHSFLFYNITLPEAHKPGLLAHVGVVSLEPEGVVGGGGAGEGDVGGVEGVEGGIPAIEARGVKMSLLEVNTTLGPVWLAGGLGS